MPAPAPLHYEPPPRPPNRLVSIVLLTALVLTLSIFAGAVLAPLFAPTSCGGPHVACAVHLRTLGQALSLYARDHQGHFPDHLWDLHPYLRNNLAALTCPSDTTSVPPTTAPTTRALQAVLTTPGHCSYTYLGRTLATSTRPTTLLAYESAPHHKGVRTALFVDGHVELLPEPRLAQLLAPMPATRP